MVVSGRAVDRRVYRLVGVWALGAIVSKRRNARLSCTTSTQVGEAVEHLLWSGLWGNSRAAVVERLLCHAIRDVVASHALEAIAREFKAQRELE